jgi:hypothetical protein
MAGLALGSTHCLYWEPMLKVQRSPEGYIEWVERMYPRSIQMKVVEHLMEKNIIEPIYPHQAKSLSPILLQLASELAERGPAEPFVKEYGTGSLMGKGPQFQSLGPANISSFLYNAADIPGCALTVPNTPYGIVGILPDYLDASRLDEVKATFLTDQNVVIEDGNALDIETSVARVQDAAAKYGDTVAFTADNCFVGIQKFSETHYRVVLIDSGYLEQKGAQVMLKCNLDRPIKSVRDRIDGGLLNHGKHEIGVGVQEGLFRILDVELQVTT